MMLKTGVLVYLIGLVVFLAGGTLYCQTPAFPGAEGYGKYTKGGRGGAVIEVTNLNDTGPGSLRSAIAASGARTVVFKVSGTIILNSDLKITNPYITIAGQTAPGDGICIRKYSLSVNTSQVIIRYLRVRLGDESGGESDAMGGRYQKNVIIDHCSVSWSVDEGMSFYNNDSLTVQWCLISESLFNSNHPKGAHGYGGIWGGKYCTYHHNLFAHHSSRNPRFSSGCGNTDYRNNVIYNWGFNSAYGGEAKDVTDPVKYSFTNINMVANYYKSGPATMKGVLYKIVGPSSRNLAEDYGKWYITNNYVTGSPAITSNNWAGGVVPDDGSSYLNGLKLDKPFTGTMPINQQTAEEAYTSVLTTAGAILPKRDPVDTRIINEVISGNATFEGSTYKLMHTVMDPTKICGILDSQTDVGGWPLLSSTVALIDSDHDGMPDSWENENGLNSVDNSDGNLDKDGDGFTNLEHYLNSIISSSATTGFQENRALNKAIQIFPNPFYDKQSIDIEVRQQSKVLINILGITGNLIRSLKDGILMPGYHHIEWNGEDNDGKKLHTGVYFCVVKIDEDIRTEKLILIGN